MNRGSSIRNNYIAQNCRSILRERCLPQTCNYTSGYGTFPQQQVCPSDTWKPCHAIPTNPICSPYCVDNLRVPTVCCDEPSYCTTLSGLSPMMPSNGFARHSVCIDGNTAPMRPILNGQSGQIQYLSTPTEHCIQMITNAIITRIHCKIPQEEIALLCCCLPSLIRQMMCKSPWLTPNDIIQWLSQDIIKEAMNGFDYDDLNGKNKLNHNQERSTRKRKDNKLDDNFSIKSHENDNDSLSSHRSKTNAISPQSGSSRSLLDSSKKHKNAEKKKFRENKSKKNIQNHPSSTSSFGSQENPDHGSDTYSSTILSPRGHENKQKKSIGGNPDHNEDNESHFSTPSKDSNLSINTFNSDEDSDEKNTKSRPGNLSSRIEFPGKKDPNAIKDVEKCLAFYDKIREYFEDDVSAMLLKCCLCYGDCSGRR